VARGRWVKPEFFKDRKIGQLGSWPAILYQALWVVADDGGVAPCDPDRLKGEMFYSWPGVGLPEIGEGLAALEGAGRIRRYQNGDDVYCEIPNFLTHQKIKNPSTFRFPRTGEALPQDYGRASTSSTSNLDTKVKALDSVSNETGGSAPDRDPPFRDDGKPNGAYWAPVLRSAAVPEASIGDVIQNWLPRALRDGEPEEIAVFLEAEGQRRVTGGHAPWNPAAAWNLKNDDCALSFRYQLNQWRKAQPVGKAARTVGLR
jgi:hypothetical protein